MTRGYPPCFTPSIPVRASSILKIHSIPTPPNKLRCPTLPRTHRYYLTPTITRASLPPLQNVSVILLAGGSGKRMQADRPKQFLPLAGIPVLDHSLQLFAAMPEVWQIILVLDSSYHPLFSNYSKTVSSHFSFAPPGKERQDSVYNGLSIVRDNTSLVCIHDAARPLVTPQNVRDVLRDAQLHGAAVLGVPSKATIKESEDGQFVLRTIPRNRLWEIQTPQVIKPALLKRGFAKVHQDSLEVTDDVSIVELLGEPVKITMGEYTNIKLTTPEDMNIAESILNDRASTSASLPA